MTDQRRRRLPTQNVLTGMYHLDQYGGDKTGAADTATVLQPLVQALTALPQGGTIYAPDGTYRLNTFVPWASNVSMVNFGAGAKFLGYMDINACFRAISGDGFNSGNPLTNVTFKRIFTDGSNQTQSGGYTAATKGFFFTYMSSVHFIECQAINHPATGFGTDFAITDVVFRDCIAKGNGRLGISNSPGASGIGIGTAGTTNSEAFTVTGCTVIANLRYGIFVEDQVANGANAAESQGGRITDNYVSGGQVGIGNSGNRYMVIEGNEVVGSTTAAISFDIGTLTAKGRPGYDSIIANNIIHDVPGIGINLDYRINGNTTTAPIGGLIKVNDNYVKNCTAEGVKVVLESVDVVGIQIIDNVICNNGDSGLWLHYSGTTLTGSIKQSAIRGNLIYNNGTTSTTNRNDGIRCDVPLVDVDIEDNFCFDNQGSKTQGYGFINTGTAMSGGSLRGNDFRTNKTGPVSLTNPVSATTAVGSNLGYTPAAPASVTVTASPMTYTAPSIPSVLWVIGGTVSSVTVGGVQVASATGLQISLEPGDSVVLTYSVAPTLASRARA